VAVAALPVAGRKVTMRPRTRTLLAWSLWLASFGCCAAGLVVTLAVVRPLTAGALAEIAASALAFALGFATVGLVLTLRRPANPIGWLYAAAGLAWSWSIPVEPWITQLVHNHHPLPPAAQLAAVAADLSWAPAIALGVTLPALLVPDGRLRSRRWRLVVATSVTGVAMIMVFASVAPGRLQNWPIDNPLGLGGPAGTAARMLGSVGLVLHWASLPAAAACVVLRFRSSQGVERQQLRWVAAGVAAAVAGLLLALPGIVGLLPRATMLVIYPAMLCPPVAVAVAVLRYRLYDLDRIISRGLVYGLLTAGGIGLYVGVVRLAETLLRGRVGLGGSLVATALVAVGFAPARERLQRLVDRWLYGERHDPVRAVARLGERLRGTRGSAAAGDGLAELLQGVCEALRLPFASLQAGQAEVARVGQPGGPSESVPLDHGGERLGELLVGVRSGEQGLGVADRRVLDVLAAPVAVALHAVLLSQQLQHSRERLVAAREEERRRLRRDLHDGLGPILTAVTLKADAARSALQSAPERADGLLAGLRGDAKQALGDLRRVVYDLRPAALDELGLLGALRQQVDRFDRDRVATTLQAPQVLPPLPAAVEVAALRIITEALTNIARHAHARHATVTLAVDGSLGIEVCDDGATPTGVEQGWRPGVGLQSMAERAAEVGGTLQAGPTPTGGRVQARLPLEPT
jgi:two-component system NarL family sensor kinase